MNARRTVVALSIASLLLLPACGRLVRTASRMGSRGSSGSGGAGSSQPTPEEMRFQFTATDSAAKAKLDGYRATFAQYVEKYGAGELSGSAQVIAVLDGINGAHWSERPKAEDCARPIGTAIGDVLKREAGVDWGLGHGTLLCMFSPNGKVLVGTVDIAHTWLANKTHPMSELINEVKNAVRDTTGMPIEIGTKPDVDESGEDMI